MLATGMNVSVLLRLLPEPLAHGHLVGEVEVERTGERATVKSAEELVDYLRGVTIIAGRPQGKAQGASPETTNAASPETNEASPETT
jgi:hypothetical protein